jgi:hypothetical protein
MKVNDRKGLIDPALGVSHGVPHGPGAAAPIGGDGDQVTVSGAARELARLRGEVGDVGAVDQEKLRGLAAVMARGQYSADLRDVAKKMLRELLSDVLG